ncbi:MAG: hypothetical protein AAF340_12935 [Pseudomonadota bacterium]
MAKFYIFVFLISLGVSQPSLAGSPWHGLQADPLARTCNYFENRARFLKRGPNMQLDAMLADSCRTALHRMIKHIGTTPYEAKRARAYLERLTDYKRVVISMNTNGFLKARSERPVQLGGAPQMKVSKAGEYLIARQMGVIVALNDWAHTARFHLAKR